MQKVSYRGWPNCHRLANDRVEVIATTDVGPRIIHLGVPGGENVMGVMAGQAGLTGGDEWRIYGGHRLWHSPEARPRSYFADNGPIDAVIDDGTLRLIQPAEVTTGISKEIDVTLIGDQPHVEVHHRLENNGLWAVELAPWALTVLNLDGVAIVPHSDWPTADNLLPNRSLTLWPYSDMRDPRIHWGSRYVMLRQDPRLEPPFKVGLNCTAGWAAYYRHGQLLVKCFDYEPDALYPDGGCSVETYTNSLFLELETLGPLTLLEPGDLVEHVEHWFLYDEIEPVASEEEVERIVRPLAEQALVQAFF
jgi:hypothetical protein